MILLYALQKLEYQIMGSIQRQVQSRQSKVIGQGAFMAFRREALEQVWDEYVSKGRQPGDDADVSLLLMEVGWKSIRAPEAIAHSQIKTSWRSYLRQQARWMRTWYIEWPRIKKQLCGHSLLLTSLFWLHTLLPTPVRIYAFLTRNKAVAKDDRADRGA